MAKEKNIPYYGELILVAVFSIVAANCWNQLLNRYLETKNWKTNFLIAVIITCFAVSTLFYLFAAPKKNNDKNNTE